MRIYLVYCGLVIGMGGLLWWMAQEQQGQDQGHNHGPQRLPLWRMLYVAGAIALCVLLWHGPEPYRLFGDFTKAYYFAGQQVLQGSRDLYGDACVRGYVNIPIVAIAFAPFAQFSPAMAGGLMAAVGVATTAAACGGLLRLTQVTGWRQWALVGLFLASGPVYYNLRLGNTTQYVLLLLIGALACWRKGWPEVAGGLVAIAGIIKIPILLLGVYFLLRGRLRTGLGFGLGLIAVVGLSLLLFGPALHGTWYTQCIQPFAGKPLSAFNVQSVDGLLARLLGGNPATWIPMTVGLPFKLLRYGLLSAIVGAVVWTFWRAQQPLKPSVSTEKPSMSTVPRVKTVPRVELEWVTVLCLALLISPISWTHYYLLLLLPIGLLLGHPQTIPPGGHSLLLLSALLISLPVTLYQPAGMPWLLGQAGFSHYFIGGVLLLSVLLAAQWRWPENGPENGPENSPENGPENSPP
jgi:hypothetical protein